jgi:opacity protein-like surface antigen
MAIVPQRSDAEWYVGGYGGYSMPGKLRDVQMPLEGERQALAQFPGFNAVAGDKLTSSLSGSDISLKSSAMFGGKAGYFFKDEGFSWLGVEVEAFTSQPTIKETKQGEPVTTILDATYVPGIPSALNPPTSISQPGTPLQLAKSSMRLITVVFNVVARYPGTTFQPYVGIGGGAFHFSGSGQIDGRQVVPGLNAQLGLKVLATEEWALFVEGKYNYATITNLDPIGMGLSGVYSAFNAIAGIAYHF